MPSAHKVPNRKSIFNYLVFTNEIESLDKKILPSAGFSPFVKQVCSSFILHHSSEHSSFICSFFNEYIHHTLYLEF